MKARDYAIAIVFLLGAGLLVGGVAMMHHPAAMITAGLLLLFVVREIDR